MEAGVGCYIFLEAEGSDPTAVTVTLTVISTYLGRRSISVWGISDRQLVQ